MEIKDTSKYIAFNSYGGFNEKKDEYHILNPKTPLPWCNVMANENFGTIISTYGTVYTFFKNSQGYKITNWCNDWITFKPGEKFKGIFEENYNLVYGFGYTKILEEDENFKKTMDIFVPNDENIKVQYITLENKKNTLNEIEIEYTLDPVLGVTKETNLQHILCRDENNTLYLKNPYSIDFSHFLTFCKVFVNNEKNRNNSNISIIYDEQSYSIKVKCKIEKESKLEFAIVLGSSETGKEYISNIIDKYSDFSKFKETYENTKKYWRKKVVRNFKLENEYLEIMANGWLLYQTIACRLFARSGFYQSGGAVGYRDQLQDTLSLISTWPERTRAQIILHASKQFEKGDVLHWWHEHNNAGIRTYFSDDYLWLPYVLAEYVERTKDESILKVMTKYLEDKPMGDRREVYDIYLPIEKEDSVYEHAKKTIMYGLSRINEKNGLLDIGDGDWNDGFSNIRGQSVWLTFFMMDILKKFESLAKIMKDKEMIKTCEKYRHVFKHAIISNAWDGTHFVRAFFENGDVLGSNKNDECKIDLISQAWAVIAMKEYPDVQEELKESLKSADKYLVDKEHMIVKLLYPAFDKPKNNPGYIKAYVPGTRENGGQYTHAATWLAKAYFDIGEEQKAIEILRYICPISHSDSKESADVYMVEPYVVAADIYSNPDHPGRGGWTWYTGSAGWMYKVIEDYFDKK